MRAIRVEEFGGPDVLKMVDAPEPEPGEGQVLIKVSRAGINYADTMARQDTYVEPQKLPFTPGVEVAGTVERAADGLEAGQRVVAFVSGAYAEYAVGPAATCVPLPDGADDEQALAVLLQGLTAWHILKTSARLEEGESVVVHAAAGGVGSLAVQLAKRFGAGRVIATASSEEKRRLASDLGADAVVDSRADDLTGALKEANGGEDVDVVLEMAGGRVFDQSLEALAPFGRLVTYGAASGEGNQVSSFDLLGHSRAVVGFYLFHALGNEEQTARPLEQMFEMVASGDLRPVVGGTYPLSEASRAHEEMQGRGTSGKLLLDPSA
ncbi:MAG: quinone oxidoreductase [Thermoleophilaceae bacterium]|jgi:NADPH2:quinone reductase|nr:quinone oxidoreductase [Thermoleophilaceae bacterium]